MINPSSPNEISTYGYTTISNGVKWVVGDYATTYRGRVYRLHVVKGLPNGTGSTFAPFYGKVYTATKTYRAADVIIKAAFNTALGFLDSTGILSSGITLAEMYKDLHVSNPVLNSGANATFSINLNIEQTAIFVRADGDLQTSNVFCYAGNKTCIETVITVPKNTASGGATTDTITQPNAGIIKSKNYDSTFAKACEVYFNASQNNNFNGIAVNEMLSSITVTLIGNAISCKVPTSLDFFNYQYKF